MTRQITMRATLMAGATTLLMWSTPATASDQPTPMDPMDHTGHGSDHTAHTSHDAHDAHNAHNAPISTPAPDTGTRRILYYRNPMGLPDTSPVPKKDSMGMDYVPVYEDSSADASASTPSGSSVRIDLDKVQKLGVTTAVVALRPLARMIRAIGTVQLNERAVRIISRKYEGWIETLHVNTTGQAVSRGTPLMEVYSPAIMLAQQEYLAAYRAASQTGSHPAAQQLMASAATRLQHWDIPEAQLQRIRATGQVDRTFTIVSPYSGVVLEKSALHGMRFMPGESLYRIADLSTVWVIAELFEQDIGIVQTGQPATVTIPALPGHVWRGKVDFIAPLMNPDTRTVQVRIELPQGTGTARLRPALHTTVEIAAQAVPGHVVTVPESAVLDSGTRHVVLVQREAGLYEPRPVRIGHRSDGYVELLAGVQVGESVVTRATFLIDAEANLRAALGHFMH